MKILWLSHLLPYPPKGGVLQRSHHLLKQAASWGEVDLVALRQQAMQATPEARDAAVAALEAFCRSVTPFDLPTDRSRGAWLRMVLGNLPRRRPYDAAWLASRPLAEHLRRIDWNAYDLVHVDTVGLMQYVPRDAGPAVVLNHHNVESHMMARRAERESSPLRRAYLRMESRKLARLEREACPAVACNLVVSELDGERLRSLTGPVVTAVVDNGVDVEYFRPRTEPGSGEGLVFAGGMGWYPNREAMEYFVRDIWPVVAERLPGLSATIIGRDPTPPVAEAARRWDRLRVTGWVDDVRPPLDDAAIYFCPILDGGGTRLKILDALAMAKPLVATEMAVEGLDLVEGSEYLRAETPTEYLEQIERLMDDPGLRRELAVNGRATVEERYSWEAIGRKMKAAYDAAVSSSASGTGPGAGAGTRAG